VLVYAHSMFEVNLYLSLVQTEREADLGFNTLLDALQYLDRVKQQFANEYEGMFELVLYLSSLASSALV